MWVGVVFYFCVTTVCLCCAVIFKAYMGRIVSTLKELGVASDDIIFTLDEIFYH